MKGFVPPKFLKSMEIHYNIYLDQEDNFCTLTSLGQKFRRVLKFMVKFDCASGL